MMDISKLTVSEAIFLAAIPATGYMAAYAYELSYCEFFGIPSSAIQVSLDSVVCTVYRVGWRLLIFLLTLILVVAAIAKRVGDSPVIGMTVVYLLVLGLVSIALAVNGVTPAAVSTWVFAAAVVTFYLFVAPLIWQRGKQTYVEKFEAEQEANRLFGAVDRLLELFDVRLQLALLGMAVFIGAAQLLGTYDARHAETFPVRRGENRVLVRQYGSTLVEVDFDPKTRQLMDVVRYSSIAASPQTDEFRFRKTGRLKSLDAANGRAPQ